MKRNFVWEMHKKYIIGTPEKGMISDGKARVGKIKKIIADLLRCQNRRVYVKTRALKHLYDKKPAEEFDFVIDHLARIIANPDFIYHGRDGRRGNFCFVVEIKESQYIAAMELVEIEDGRQELQIVTAFRMRHERYLNDYELLWSRRDGVSSSPHHSEE
jgi:hypothetical protein